jgi:glycolate oxidase
MNMPGRIEERQVQQIIDIAGKENTFVQQSQIDDYTHDMADYSATPGLVVRPSSEREVAEIVRVANETGTPILPRGAGSSLTGAAVIEGGIIMDLRRMASVTRVDTVNWYVQVQPGISLEDLNKELKTHGFFFPPDPASSYICTVGGAIAEGSGGLRCVRYGTMKDWVLALRVVLPSGQVVKFGEALSKNRAGYDLVHLMVGSEGTLGIITEAWLKIIPIPSVRTKRFLVTFDNWETTGEVIKRLRSSRILPHLFEFLDRDNVLALNEKLEMHMDEAEATLLVDVEDSEVQTVEDIFRQCGAVKITLARDEEEADAFYQARSMAYLAVKATASGVQVEDVCLPIDKLADYLKMVKQVAAKYGLKIPVNGHAGDGNVHPLILYEKSDEKSRDSANLAYEEICRWAISMGGSVTGEHGVGLQKPKFMREQLEAHDGREALRIMKEIKKIFDPYNIMNPGKYVEIA